MKKQRIKFGTFQGVFTPTILTIVGVILYLRLGWVVGSVGLPGAILIILLAHVATISTAFSVGALATNTKVGAGGFYALITRSLGLEFGGAIGIPLFISQALGTSLYIIGFTETWVYLFPEHLEYFRVVASFVFLAVFVLSFLGAGLAMKVQYFIMAVIVLSLSSFAFGLMLHYEGFGEWRMPVLNNNFWQVFAVFFPAVTGIGAGAAMSGDLKNPKKSLPLGIFVAVFSGLVIYLAAALVFKLITDDITLISNPLAVVEKSFWGPAVIAGIMGATFSSALGSILAAPRILMALGQDNLVPLSRWFSLRTRGGEPRIAHYFTSIIILATIWLGDLNSIASLLTMFFLITYAGVNLSVFFEKLSGTTSFRPSFQVPSWIPLTGGLWCLVVMFLIQPWIALMATVLILLMYLLQLRRGLVSQYGDVRSGMFNSIAEWAAAKAAQYPYNSRNWKPNLLVPIEDPENWQERMAFVRDIIIPRGTLRVYSLLIHNKPLEQQLTGWVKRVFAKDTKLKLSDEHPEYQRRFRELDALIAPLRKRGVFSAARVVEVGNYLEGMNVITQIMKGMFFPPNVCMLTMSDDSAKLNRLKEMVAFSIKSELGILLLSLHPEKQFGQRQNINVWIRSESPNIHLSFLIALMLEKNWDGKLRIISVVREEKNIRLRHRLIGRLIESARLPRDTEVNVFSGNFKDCIAQAPQADIQFLGLADSVDLEQLKTTAKLLDSTCLFVRDSGVENSLS